MRRSLVGNLTLLAVLSLGLAVPTAAWAQLCPESMKECNNRCIAMSETCAVADSSNKFLLLGAIVGVGALIGLGFFLNPDDDDDDAAAPKSGGKAKGAASPIDLSVHENGGGLLWRGTF